MWILPRVRPVIAPGNFVAVAADGTPVDSNKAPGSFDTAGAAGTVQGNLTAHAANPNAHGTYYPMTGGVLQGNAQVGLDGHNYAALKIHGGGGIDAPRDCYFVPDTYDGNLVQQFVSAYSGYFSFVGCNVGFAGRTGWYFDGPVRVGYYTVAGLPAATYSSGLVAFASNGRKVGEGAGAGTGVLVVSDGTVWRRLSDDTAVAA